MLLPHCLFPSKRRGFKWLLLVLTVFVLLLWPLAFDGALALRRQMKQTATVTAWKPAGVDGNHPIDDLIRDANLRFEALLQKRSTSLAQTTQRYLDRRGRRPPPGFDAWYEAAERSNAVVVEDFFDRIHDDIAPMWAVEPRTLRRLARGCETVVRVRAGKVVPDLKAAEASHRYRQWEALVAEMAQHLPDLDMPVNTMDESRVLVTWETMDGYVSEERRLRSIVDAGQAVGSYGPLNDEDDDDDESIEVDWIRDQVAEYWSHYAATCPPDSPGRNATSPRPLSSPVEYPRRPVAAYTHRGFVYNFTGSQDACLQPHLNGMHGTFIESISMSTTHQLLPMFGESKLPRNNELLIPAAVYLDDGRLEYSGGADHGGRWDGKRNGLVWRGVSSGGRNRRDNWRRMQRNRFIQMLNGSVVDTVERLGDDGGGGDDIQHSFRLAADDVYPVQARRRGRLGEWVSTWADAGFVEALCEPPEDVETIPQPPTRFCRWLRPEFSVASSVPMKDMYDYKFLPDVDGNSFSGRFRALLLSTSLPLKATIYAEWHDYRLIPWVHFVPMDNSFMDLYAIMDYLMGRDERASRIAADGKTWAEAVLRREDMKLYVWRLLLEYARVVRDGRHGLAFVGEGEV
ncbi:lipopolysaccharide-modifying protein [Ophiocordyceps camponoti-floridani]|uniref:Lipopolysaccharide-modifying protein n=1 Tax=Ophiocordyceps camponoti-floridani TaxID=2030778 RepID=A0A8H4VBY2_9HYPO|nr:lipopolysaccharide-modifying protein [Ophiocordyceps camponoti-floridani]